MKYILNLFLIFYVVLKPLVPIIDYAIRYDYISKELCENKSKPELLCNGKCYLTKEIAKNTDNTSKSETPKSTIHIDTFLIKDVLVIVNSQVKSTKQVVKHYISSFYFFDLNSSIFHPPLV
ncbi:hypothetical protein [Soonwooa sp.]|uniref:hypothetical protein n=1 Tax=Soonwooa sp. TaxID=1938592 RepID=UPI0028A19BF2|nr:hypothetical protein [Soonwooa sp.]